MIGLGRGGNRAPLDQQKIANALGSTFRTLEPGETPVAAYQKMKAKTKNGAALIADERERQIAVEGWTAEHDDTHKFGELSDAGAAYAKVASAMVRGAEAAEFDADMMLSEGDWPFDEASWKPSDDAIQNLVKAGALIAAEIDRIQRQ